MSGHFQPAPASAEAIDRWNREHAEKERKQRRYEIARDVLAGMAANREPGYAEAHVTEAVQYAELLLARLEKE